MSKELDMLMAKMEQNKVKVKSKPLDEVTNEDLEKLETNEDEFEDEEDEVEETPEPTSVPAQKPVETPKVEKLGVKAPAQNEIPQENPIEAEVGILQNDGIFRRELLLTLKDLVDVQKAHAELLIKLVKEKK